MNVFVLSTGRCGSQSFAQACRHLQNLTSGHETHPHLLGVQRVMYPDDHIEIDNRLSWFLGRLDEVYGPSAFYVHLVRDEQAVARSYNKRWRVPGGIMAAYHTGILMRGRGPGNDLATCLDYVRTVNSNIAMFLKDKPYKMIFRLEHAKTDFTKFWRAVGGTGDLGKATATWDEPVDHRRIGARVPRTP